MPTVKLITGNALTVLKTLSSESVNMIVTSPPYYGIRDYGIAGQIGLEHSIKEYTNNLILVFREARRVLRHDGTLWLNLGDSYSHKNLLGIPWTIALALRDDGWYLRSDIIWYKPNPMPEKTTDRPIKAHDYLFLLSKSEQYYYDNNAIREPHKDINGTERFAKGGGIGERKSNQGWAGGKVVLDEHRVYDPLGRNKHSVWIIPSAPYKEAHFATFPPALVDPCILAGTSSAGVCINCGNPQIYNTNWKPNCKCKAAIIPATVLDPFSGSGTTGLRADRLMRDAILIELNPEYTQMARKRISGLLTKVIME